MKARTRILPFALLALVAPYGAMASSATSEVHTVITANNGGTSVVDIQTSTNGEVHTEHIEKTIPAGATVEFNYATSSYSAGSTSSTSAKGSSAARAGVTMRIGGHAATSSKDIRAYGFASTSSSSTNATHASSGLSFRIHQSFSNFTSILSSLFSWLNW